MTILIRRAEPSDYEAMQRIFSSSRVIWGTLQLPFPSIETWRKRLADPTEGMIRLVACADDEPIGQLDLVTYPNHPRRRHAAEIGMAVRDDWQGKQVGSALLRSAIDLADNWLNLLRLELKVFTDNTSAIHLYEKFDFRKEGLLINYAYRDGQFVDVNSMARLRGHSQRPDLE